MLLCKFEVPNELLYRLKPCEDNILSFKRIFSEENIECCDLLMFVLNKICVRASKLIEIVAKQINLSHSCLILHNFLNIN